MSDNFFFHVCARHKLHSEYGTCVLCILYKYARLAALSNASTLFSNDHTCELEQESFFYCLRCVEFDFSHQLFCSSLFYLFFPFSSMIIWNRIVCFAINKNGELSSRKEKKLFVVFHKSCNSCFYGGMILLFSALGSKTANGFADC